MNSHSVCCRSHFAAVIMGDTIIAIGGRTAEYLVLGEKAWKDLPEMNGYTPGETACVFS